MLYYYFHFLYFMKQVTYVLQRIIFLRFTGSNYRSNFINIVPLSYGITHSSELNVL
jgi:hypothetical protein